MCNYDLSTYVLMNIDETCYKTPYMVPILVYIHLLEYLPISYLSTNVTRGTNC